MQLVTDIFNGLFFTLMIVATPVVIFFSARKIAEWVVGIVLLFAIIFYYTDMLIQVLTYYNFWDGLISPIIGFLQSYKMFILYYWPQFDGISVFGINLFGMKVDPAFTPTWFPLAVLYVGGLIRFVVVRFVPHNRLRDVTREYWLYITAFLIALLIAGSILDWNILIILLIFLLTLLVISAGLQRILIDPFILVVGIIRHSAKWIWIGMKHVASIAADIAKFLYKLLKIIRELYHKYIQLPFIRLHEKLSSLEKEQEEKVNEKLKQKRFEDDINV